MRFSLYSCYLLILTPGKRLHNYGQSPCIIGKSTISMVINGGLMGFHGGLMGSYGDQWRFNLWKITMFKSYFDITRG